MHFLYSQNKLYIRPEYTIRLQYQERCSFVQNCIMRLCELLIEKVDRYEGHEWTQRIFETDITLLSHFTMFISILLKGLHFGPQDIMIIHLNYLETMNSNGCRATQ